MDPQAASELVPVDDDVVRVRERVARVPPKPSRHSSVGRVNGWCFAAQRSTSSSHSNIGKSVTQRKVNEASSIRPSSRPRWRRRWPSTRDVSSTRPPRRAASLPRRARAPTARPPTGTSRSASGLSPSSRTSTRDPSPSFLRDLLERASSARGTLGTRRYAPPRPGEDARPEPPGELGGVLELEPEPRVGLVGAEPPIGLVVGHARPRRLDLDLATGPAQMVANISSISGREPRGQGLISTSSCVSSWTRSARRSSSRKQIAIW